MTRMRGIRIDIEEIRVQAKNLANHRNISKYVIIPPVDQEEHKSIMLCNTLSFVCVRAKFVYIKINDNGVYIMMIQKKLPETKEIKKLNVRAGYIIRNIKLQKELREIFFDKDSKEYLIRAVEVTRMLDIDGHYYHLSTTGTNE